jgi:hypothetical protein
MRRTVGYLNPMNAVDAVAAFHQEMPSKDTPLKWRYFFF